MAIQTINTSDNGNTFVGKLNNNFAECMTGGGQRTIYMQLQGGKIATSTSSATTIEHNNVVGYPCVSTDDNEFLKNCHTTLLLSLENCLVNSVTLLTGESLTIFCYGADGSYLSNVSSVQNIPDTAFFVRFMVSKSTAYSSLRSLEVSVQGKPMLIKNSTPSLVTDAFFSFETTYPSQFETTDNDTSSSDVENAGKNYMGSNNNARYYDNAWIKLPPNYSAEGDPIPLVVYIHGTNGFDFYKGPYDNGYGPLQSFIANNGYAVCDCSGITSKDKVSNLGSNDYDEAFYSPSFISAIADMVRYITANYNVKDDGVYIYGKSAGGYTLHLMTVMQGLKIKAAASLAPGISSFSSIEYYLNNELRTTKRVFSQLGITSVPTGTWNNDKAIVLANIHKLREVDCLFKGTDLSDSEVASVVTTLLNSDSSVNFSSGKKDYTKSSACMTILNATRLHVPTPTKIWCAADDANVPYSLCKLYVDMAQRAGSPVYMRRMPSNKGKHHSVDTDPNAPTVTYQTKYGGSVTVAVAYAELVDWFNRW